ncbi:DEK domain-containing chromatin associated protein [Artemisia annua]|uniref:DEK domain-containing chromatin associated protein n=1 Tax=Artemisia annua TaxID=35608 RepID=A0A2U1MAW7_ARTAN|nr:DEK domain-containing chromatin associated protein [Artemisia annua]
MAPEIETLENKKQQQDVEDVEMKEQEEVSEGGEKKSSAKKAKKGESSPVTPNERPTRERKTVERFMESMTRSLTPKAFTIEKGSGTQLKEIPNGIFYDRFLIYFYVIIECVKII